MRTALNWQLLAVYVGLALITLVVFGQATGHQFVNYDDQNYVYENPQITRGLTWSGLATAFTRPHAQNWHPLTTISHMLDCQLWGLDPAGHHLVNVLLHAAAALLLFSLLNGMTGKMWRSAFVAAVFAIHPLRAESVAWVSERKDVLSGVFFMLTLCAYLRYVRKQRLGRYALTVLCFAMALMSKPTVITLPLLLLLLDFWPLRRFSKGSNEPAPSGLSRVPIAQFFTSTVFLEKIPLLLLSFISAAITLFVQRHTVEYSQSIAVTARLGNALFSYALYVGQMIWPAKLAVFYPHAADHVSLVQAAACGAFLMAISVSTWNRRADQPYLIFGWAWYLVSMLPVIGLVQVGLQGHADRYTYLSEIGLSLGVTWWLSDLVRPSKALAPYLGLLAVVTVGLLGWRASVQTAVWKDTVTLWKHALAVTTDNDVAHNNIAAILLEHGRFDEAIAHYEAALRVGTQSETHSRLSPAIVQNSLGNAWARKGDYGAAIVHYRSALQLRPEFPDARSNLCAMLLRTGKLPEAITEFQKVIATSAEDAVSHQRLAAMLMEANRTAEAVVHYRRAVELAPDSMHSLNALAWILSTNPDPEIRNAAEALVLAKRANHLTHGKDAVVLRILAAAYAANGDPPDAVATARQALSLAGSNLGLARALESEIESYRLADR